MSDTWAYCDGFSRSIFINFNTSTIGSYLFTTLNLIQTDYDYSFQLN